MHRWGLSTGKWLTSQGQVEEDNGIGLCRWHCSFRGISGLIEISLWREAKNQEYDCGSQAREPIRVASGEQKG
jgi:hypothetical protein